MSMLSISYFSYSALTERKLSFMPITLCTLLLNRKCGFSNMTSNLLSNLRPLDTYSDVSEMHQTTSIITVVIIHKQSVSHLLYNYLVPLGPSYILNTSWHF
jgi:hypothetical protein